MSDEIENNNCPECGSVRTRVMLKPNLAIEEWSCGSGRGPGCFEQSGICRQRSRKRRITHLESELAAAQGEIERLRGESKFDRIEPDDIDRLVLAGLRAIRIHPRDKANARTAITNGILDYLADIDETAALAAPAEQKN